MSEQKPWWKRKRWWAAGALWLVLAYFVSVGPLGYAIGRGWVRTAHADIYIAPILLLDDLPPMEAIESYARWWVALGEQHRLAAD